MHSRLIVLSEKKNGKNSEQIRGFVYEWLIENGFTGEGNRFHSPPSDWFVIGGRWSGDLTASRLDQKKMKVFEKEFEKAELGWMSLDQKEDTQRQKTKTLFRKHFPDFKGEMPIYRNRYGNLGAEDDAQIVDEHLLEKVVEPLLKNDGKDTEYGGYQMVCADDENYDLPPVKEIIGMWAVVVDYHF